MTETGAAAMRTICASWRERGFTVAKTWAGSGVSPSPVVITARAFISTSVSLLMVTLTGRSYQIPYNIEPETLLVEKDTVVIWTLFGAYDAQVLFLDGDKCQKATEAPVGFELDSRETKACYRGVLIPNGGTASLKFKEPGVYEYSVKWANTPRQTRAKVVVY